MRSHAVASTSAFASVNRVSYPAIAATCAMPWPIVPAPITATRVICDFRLRLGFSDPSQSHATKSRRNRAAAVDDDRLTGDVVRGIRRQKHGDALQFSGAANASEWCRRR